MALRNMERLMRIEPYLYFNGRCEQALEFYRQVVGAEITALLRFKDLPGTPTPSGAENKVLHASFRIGESNVLASDGQCHGALSFQGFSLSLTAVSNREAEQVFAALADGGHVQVPLSPTPFATRFGMAADRFGVPWTISAHEERKKP
jgi:PhnB protein